MIAELEELPARLSLLVADQELTERLFQGATRKAVEYSPASLLEQWVDLLEEVRATDRKRSATLRARVAITATAIRRRLPSRG